MVEEIGSYISPAQAASLLGVSVRRVHVLVGNNTLRSVKAGDRVLVHRDDVESRARTGSTAEGRPFSARRAWALILLASDKEVPNLDAVTRSKLRKVLKERDLWSLRPRLRKRSERRDLRAHSSELEAILHSTTGVRTGARAALEVGLDLVAPDAPVELYVNRRGAADLVRLFALQSSREPNVILRVVPDEVRSWLRGPIAPRLAVALDLAEENDARSQDIAQDALANT